MKSDIRGGRIVMEKVKTSWIGKSGLCKSFFGITLTLVVCGGTGGLFAGLASVSKKHAYSPVNLHMISIGYDRPMDKKLSELKYSESDARKLAGKFTEEFETIRPKDGKIFSHVLLGKSATKTAIQAAFLAVIREASTQDTFIFFFTGHDLGNSSGADYSLLTADSHLISTEKLRSESGQLAISCRNCISLSELKSWLTLIRASSQLIILDANDTKNFVTQFSSIVLEVNPEVSLLSQKNRIFILPDYGVESDEWGGGLIAQSLIHWPKDPGLFSVFGNSEGLISDESSRHFELQLIKQQLTIDPNLKFRYADVIYERKLFPLISRGENKGLAASENPAKVEKTADNPIRKYALIIATDTYKGTPTWAELSNPMLDAKSIAEALRSIYGFTIDLVENPTKKQIMTKLIEYKRRAYGPKDQLVVFITGHGDYSEDTHMGYIVAHDSKNRRSDPWRESYVDFNFLQNVLTHTKAPHQLLIIDACFGGTFDRRISESSAKGSDDDEYDPIPRQELIERKLKYKSRLYLTSGGKQLVLDGAPGKHSPFARKLLEALRSRGGKDRVLTFGEIKRYLEKVQPEPRAGDFEGNEVGSDFPLIAK